MSSAKKARVPATTRAAKRAGTRAQVRLAAYELFSTRGFDETTTQAIAERAGIAAGTVFLHARDKPDLLFLVMHDRLEQVVTDRFASLPPPPATLNERFMHIFRGVFAMYGEHPKLGAAFVKHLPGSSGPNADRVNLLTFGFLHRLALLVKESQERGEVASDLEPTACAQNVFALYFMALLVWLSGHSTIEAAVDSTLRTALELQMRGFRA